MSVICDSCSKTFTLKRNLVRHQKTCDGTFLSSSIKCPECLESTSFSNLNILKRHIEDVHEIKLKETEHKFRSVDDFQKWKEEYEKEHLCLYAIRTSKSSRNEKISYLRCHRTGFFQSRSSGVRKIKSQGTNKIDSACPSSMTVRENENGVYVTFCETHFGHGSNLGRCHLTNKERTMIAGKIANDVSLENILDPDHTLRLNICKHIHACMEQKVLEPSNNYDSFEKALICADVPKQEEEKTSIIQSLNTAIGFISRNEYSSEEYRVLKRQAENILSTAAKKQKKVVSKMQEVKNNEPSNKNIEKAAEVC